MKLGGGVLGRTLFCGTLVSVLAASALSACGDDTTSGGNAGDDGAGGERPGSGGSGGTGEDPIASCDDRSTSGTKVSGTISSDTTWSGRVYLESSVTVSDATLTIEPGTVVVAAADSELTVSAGGAIVSGGTEAKPIAFCGEADEAGLWSGIAIADDAAATSELSYTLVSNAGSGEAALVLDAATLVDNIAVTDSGADGVHASTFAEGSSALTVAGATGAPVVLTHAAAVSPFPAGGDLTGNGDDVVRLEFESAEVDMTFAKLSVPYLQEADLDVVAGDVEYLAGVVYHLAEQVMLDVGVGTESVRFDVTGTEEEPVKFEGPGLEMEYLRIRLNSLVSTESAVRHAEFRYGLSALEPSSAVTLDHLLIEECHAGLKIAEGFGAGSANIVLRDISSQHLIIAADAVFSLPADTQILGDYPLLMVSAGTLSTSGTLVDIGVPYTFSSFDWFPRTSSPSPLVIAAGATLEVPAGISFELDGLHTVIVHGALKLLGTAAQPVIVKQNQFQAYTTIEVAADADPTTTFEHVQFSSGMDCLTLRQLVPVTNSSFDGCVTAGIRAYPAGDDTLAEYQALCASLSMGTTTPNGTDCVYE